jgi:hypothetical protein
VALRGDLLIRRGLRQSRTFWIIAFWLRAPGGAAAGGKSGKGVKGVKGVYVDDL